MRRSAVLAGTLLLYSCGPSRPEPTGVPPPPPPRAEQAKKPGRCGASPDARGPLARHALGYGSPEVVAASLPVVLSGKLTIEARTGVTEIVVTREATRSYSVIAGITSARGIDAAGAWSMGGSGIVERQSGVEAVDA